MVSGKVLVFLYPLYPVFPSFVLFQFCYQGISGHGGPMQYILLTLHVFPERMSFPRTAHV